MHTCLHAWGINSENVVRHRVSEKNNNNKKHMIMKKILLLFLCLLAGAQMVNAQTAYVSVGENHMTFRYDTYYGKPDEGYTEYLLNSGNQKPGWLDRCRRSGCPSRGLLQE